MMPTREGLELDISIGIYDELLLIASGTPWEDKSERLAKAALDALLSSLPEAIGKCPHGCYFVKNTHSSNYMELLGMKK